MHMPILLDIERAFCFIC